MLFNFVYKQSLKQQVQSKSIILVIEDTGNRKKGKTSDYDERHYIGNLGKIEHGIVSVNASGIFPGRTFQLMFKVFKPKKRLKPDDIYQTKLQLAQQIIQELLAFGFQARVGRNEPFTSSSSSSSWSFVWLENWD